MVASALALSLGIHSGAMLALRVLVADAPATLPPLFVELIDPVVARSGALEPDRPAPPPRPLVVAPAARTSAGPARPASGRRSATGGRSHPGIAAGGDGGARGSERDTATAGTAREGRAEAGLGGGRAARGAGSHERGAASARPRIVLPALRGHRGAAGRPGAAPALGAARAIGRALAGTRIDRAGHDRAGTRAGRRRRSTPRGRRRARSAGCRSARRGG